MQRTLTTVLVCAIVLGLPLAALAADAAKPAASETKQLVNGKNLEGWVAEGKAVWTVENGCIIGRQGPGATPGDLFTAKEYANFEVTVTYKIEWPANSGIWFRYQSPEKSYQADILEFKDPECYSGTIYCPGKMFLSMNTDKSLVKKDDWNTMTIRAEGDHLTVSLNGKVVGDVKENSFAKGRIGFQVHPGDEFNKMAIIVKEVAITELP